MNGKDFLHKYGFYGMHRFFTDEERDTIMAALDRPRLEAVPTEGAAPNEVWMVSSKTITILFKSHDTALAYVAQFGASASGGMSITNVPVFE